MTITKSRINKVLKTTKELGLHNKEIFTLGELEKIAEKSESNLYTVMHVLRNER